MKYPAALVMAALAAAGTAAVTLGAWRVGPNPPLVFGLVHAGAYVCSLSLASGTAFMVAGVLLFGPVWGFVFNLAGMALGSTALGYVVRRTARRRVLAWPRLRRLAALDPGVGAALRWRWSMLPHIPLNLAVGLGQMPMRSFLWVNLAGFVPSALVFSVAGLRLRGWALAHPGRAAAAGAAVFAAGLAVNVAKPLLARRRASR